MSTSHFIWKTNDVDSAGSFTSETWLEQHFRATETSGANSDVAVWELASLLLVSRFELYAEIHTNEAQFSQWHPEQCPCLRRQ